MLYLGLRIATLLLYAGAFTLLIIGTTGPHEHQRAYFAWGLLCAITGSGMGAAVYVNCVRRREAAHHTRQIAEAVGVAMGRFMRTGDDD